MGNTMKHKRSLSENYIRRYGWQSNKLISPLYETWKSLNKEAHVRTKPKLVSANSTGGFDLARHNKHK